jgi:hypothetical protein
LVKEGLGWFVPIEHPMNLFTNQEAIDCFLHAITVLFPSPFQTTPTPPHLRRGKRRSAYYGGL